MYNIAHVVWVQELAEQPGIKIYQPIYIILVVSVLVDLIVTRRSKFRIQQLPGIPYVAVILLTLAAALQAPDKMVIWGSAELSFARHLLFCSLFWIGAAHFHRRIDLLLFAGATVITSLTLSIWVVWAAQQSSFTYFRGEELVNQNYVSLFVLAGAIPLVEALFQKRKLFLRLLALAGLFLMAYASLLLASRGIAAAAVAGMGFLIMRRTRAWSSWGKWVRGVAVFLVVLAALLLPGAENMLRRFQAEDVLSMGERTDIWLMSLRHFGGGNLLEILFGEGLFSSQVVIGRYFAKLANAHNMYLEWLMEQGIVGLLVFCYFLYWVGRRVMKCTHPFAGVLVGWYWYVLVAGLSATMPDDQYFWLLLGAVVGASVLTDKPAVATDAQSPATKRLSEFKSRSLRWRVQPE
jgi:O-antigen ligase